MSGPADPLPGLVAHAADKTNFTRLGHYVDFARRLLDAVAGGGVQAELVCQNERAYRFWQLGEGGHYNITRPFNADLMLGAADGPALSRDFPALFDDPRAVADDEDARRLLVRGVYTVQQCVGVALDGLAAGQSNRARKVNGDLFERLIQLLIRRGGVDCESGTVRVPVVADGVEQCRMRYQHDLILKSGEVVTGIGSVKTSSKDRIDKVFVDKFLLRRLTGVDTPHFAVFLGDVQRGRKTPKSYKVSSTFLPGHFKGYTIKLNPLDGVFYCDPRPNMATDPFLAERIKTIDHFFCSDLWAMLDRGRGVDADVREDPDSKAIDG